MTERLQHLFDRMRALPEADQDRYAGGFLALLEAVQGRGGVYLPFEMATGLSLEGLKARFEILPNVTSLLARRLAYSYAILFDRALILAYIDDAYLRPQVEADRLKDNTALFLSMAPIEMAVDGHVFRGRPENSIGAHLRSAFGRHGWPWPGYPMDWKRYFMEYHMGTLFGGTATIDPRASDPNMNIST